MKQDPFELLLSKLDFKKRQPNGSYMARCPAHDDRHPSLSVKRAEDGKPLWYCHAGCPQDAVPRALGLDVSDLTAGNGHQTPSTLEHEYEYLDENGKRVFIIERWSGKRFLAKRPDGTYGTDGVRLVPFNLHRVIKAVAAGETIYVTEGEKDARILEKQCGVTATTNPFGAGKWRDEYSEHLRGADVVVVRDRDDVGRAHAAQVVESLKGVDAVVHLMEPAEGKDLHDHLMAGRTLGEFLLVDPGPDGGLRREGAPSVPASSIKPIPVRWLWVNRIALAMLNLLVGAAGVGKSTIVYDLAARLSREGLRVLIVTGEDHLAAIVRPRLEVAGANLDYVDIWTHPLSLPSDIEKLKARVKELGAVLVTVDPLVIFLEHYIDTHKDASVRQALGPLAAMAEDCECAVVTILHTNRAASDDPLLRISGSGGFAAAARHVVFAGLDPLDEAGNRRILAVVKSNLAPLPPALAYELSLVDLVTEDDEVVKTSRIVWGDELPDLDPRSLLRQPLDPEERKLVEDAKDVLIQLLSDRGEVPSKQAQKHIKDVVGCSDRTVASAKAAAGVKSKKIGGGFGDDPQQWVWYLPDKDANKAPAKDANQATVPAPVASFASLQSSGLTRPNTTTPLHSSAEGRKDAKASGQPAPSATFSRPPGEAKPLGGELFVAAKSSRPWS